MAKTLKVYRQAIGAEALDALVHLASLFKHVKIVHVNSVKTGGGVAEILSRMIPLAKLLGIDMRWETIQGDEAFFQCTKLFHNLLQGLPGTVPAGCLATYEEVSKKNAEALAEKLQADCIFIHDPQPLRIISHMKNKGGKWFWRCHIDLSTPNRPLWNDLKQSVEQYDACIFSMKEFAQPLSKPCYIIPPGIDPLSDKNAYIEDIEVRQILGSFGIDSKRPYLLQVSRFDRFKDPLGVMEAYRLAKKKDARIQLVLAGSGAIDDPEGQIVLQEVQKQRGQDLDIHILCLPPDAHHTINALQRGATIVIQKSLKEGFGLTVAEALWKAKPVIGGNVGGIRLQIIDRETGFLVGSSKEAAERIIFLLQHPLEAQRLGKNGKQRISNQFLITRELGDYLTVMASKLNLRLEGLEAALQKLAFQMEG